MITNKLSARSLATIVSIALVALTTVLSANARSEDEGNKDSLYIGDNADNTVKRFDADTGIYQGVFVQSSSPKVCTPGNISGPRGLLFVPGGNLFVVNQNSNQDCSGDVLRYDRQTGTFLGELIPLSGPNAPPAPRGIILSKNHKTLFVTNLAGVSGNTPGKLQAFKATGEFIADLIPDKPATTAFHPRGVVIGPDGLLYVSNDPVLGGDWWTSTAFQPKDTGIQRYFH